MTGKKKTGAKKKTGGSSKLPKRRRDQAQTGRKPDPSARPYKRKARKRQAPQISVETYNKLQDAYFEKQSISYAAREAGVTRETARRYIEGGAAPEQGYLPIKQVWLDVQATSQEKRQLTLLKFHEEQRKELEEILQTSLAELKLIRAETLTRFKRFQASGGKDIDAAASLDSATKTHERVFKLLERTLGAPDLTVAGATEERYQNWTDEEIIRYMQTGVVPDHAR